MMALKYDLFDMVATSIMNHEPMVIVEGKDDYKIYQTIANEVNPQIQVYQVHEFEDFEAGCTGVLACLTALQPKFAERTDNIHKILGIIDRDVRPFRGEMPNHLLGLFVTKHYSIETYFATASNLRRLVHAITNSPIQDIDNQLLVFLQTDFNDSIDTLYLYSLEALKNACIRDYDTVLGYDDSPNKLTGVDFNKRKFPVLQAKKADLDAFAILMSASVADIRLIAKGKWYLHWFVHHVYPKIKILKEHCKNATIRQCRSCRVGNYQDCLLKTNQEHYRLEILQDLLLNFIDKAECADIIDTLQRLNA
jgi:Protein of unknown function (DUF4435)